MLSGLKIGSVTALKKSSSEGNCHRMEMVWKVLLQGLTFIGNVEINARWLRMGPAGMLGLSGWHGVRFPSEQLGLSGAGLAEKLGVDIAKSKVRHGGRRQAFARRPGKWCRV